MNNDAFFVPSFTASSAALKRNSKIGLYKGHIKQTNIIFFKTQFSKLPHSSRDSILEQTISFNFYLISILISIRPMLPKLPTINLFKGGTSPKLFTNNSSALKENLGVLAGKQRGKLSEILMGNLHYRPNFNPAKINKIFYYSSKEHLKISRIPKFGGEML